MKQVEVVIYEAWCHHCGKRVEVRKVGTAWKLAVHLTRNDKGRLVACGGSNDLSHPVSHHTITVLKRGV